MPRLDLAQERKRLADMRSSRKACWYGGFIKRQEALVDALVELEQLRKMCVGAPTTNFEMSDSVFDRLGKMLGRPSHDHYALVFCAEAKLRELLTQTEQGQALRYSHEYIINLAREFAEHSDCGCRGGLICWKHLFESGLAHLDHEQQKEGDSQ